MTIEMKIRIKKKKKVNHKQETGCMDGIKKRLKSGLKVHDEGNVKFEPPI